MDNYEKYLAALDDEGYRGEFEQRMKRIETIPHVPDETKRELLNDAIVRFDRRDAQASYVIEGIVTRRQIDAAHTENQARTE